MKMRVLLFTFLGVISSILAGEDPLVADFRNPPLSARAETWWHWMNGEVTREGIRADIEAAARMGMGAVQLFNAGQELGLIPPEKQARCMSPEWEDLVRYAMAECQRVGIGFYAHNSAGWTGAGGPWITPSNAMFHVETREVRVAAGETAKIAPPASWPTKGPTFYRDIRAFAFPVPPLMLAAELPQPQVTGSDEKADYTLLLRDPVSARPKLYVPESKQTPTIRVELAKGSSYFVQYDFGGLVTVRTVELMAANTFGEAPELWAGETPENLRCVCRLAGSSATWDYAGHNVPHAIPATRARYFRLVWTAKLQAERTKLSRVMFSARPTLTAPRAQMAYESRTLSSGNIDVPDERGEAVAPETIREVTAAIGADGVLRWTAPADGRTWALLRVGYRNKRRNVMPAPRGGEGLECDKFSAETVAYHYTCFPAVLVRLAREAKATAAFRGILVDSYEAGPQTWTPRMPEEFSSRRGYDLARYLPIYGGYIVGSRAVTRRFLRDMRQTGSDLIAANFYGTLHRLAQADGLTLAAETCAGGAAGTFVGDGLQHHFETDFPMTEANANGAAKRMAVSAADNAGMPVVAMEAHTGRINWGQHPGDLYRAEVGFFADGINRLVFHSTGHNPTLDKIYPGTCFSSYGCCPSRGQTWSVHARGWLDTLARTQNFLRKGLPVVDVTVYYGEEVMGPNMGLKLPGNSEALIGLDEDNDRRAGWDWDMLSPQHFLQTFEMHGTRMGAPQGVQYRLLVLRNSNYMSPAVAEKIVRLVKAGLAVLVETRPVAAPGLTDYPACDARLQAAVRELMGDLDGTGKRVRTLGKGCVMQGMTVREALAQIDLVPDFTGFTVADRRHRPRARHRREGDTDFWYVISTQENRIDQQYTCSFRVEGKRAMIFDPLTGEVSEPQDCVCSNGLTTLTLPLSCTQPKFVVFRPPAKSTLAPPAREGRKQQELCALKGPWQVRFEGIVAPPARTLTQLVNFAESEVENERFFSGCFVYTMSFDWQSATTPAEVVLDLGRVGVSAEVWLNGKNMGIAWVSPFRVNGIERALKPGRNELTVRVVNTWFNRLRGDADKPASARQTWASKDFTPKDASLQAYPSGLMGPVKLFTYNK